VTALGYFHGDDAFGLDRAADEILQALGTGAEVERWRVSGDGTTVARIAERVGTASMFGGGTLTIVTDPASLVRSKEERDALIDVVGLVADGNGLVFLEPNDGSGRRPAALVAIEAAIARAGGTTRPVRAPRQGELANWIARQARDRGIPLGSGAAKELATRVGGFVRENDVDRRRQAELAVTELDKLALRRPGEPISVEDVRELVVEAIPGSTWAWLDAISMRRVPNALDLLDRLLESSPDLVLLAQLYPRIRQLIEVGDHLASGATPGSLVRTMGVKPFVAEKRAEQARLWTLDELERALEGLVELDATVRGAPGRPQGDANRRLAWTLWVTDHVGRATAFGGSADRAAAATAPVGR
jgi:DNA polymerase III delta subunit